MENQFDKILSSKIKQSLNNYSPEYNPNNWELLKAKMLKQKRKKAIIFIISGMAASFIFGIIFSTYFYYHSNNKQKQYFARNTKTETKISYNTAKNKNNTLNHQKSSINNYLKENKNTEHKQSKMNNRKKATNKYTNKTKSIIQTKNKLKQANKKLISNNIFIDNTQNSFNNNSLHDISNTALLQTNNKQNKTTDSISNDDNFITKYPEITISEDSIIKKNIESLEDTKNTKQNYNLSALVTSQINNSITANNPEINIGGGILTDLALAQKIDIQLGVVIAKQSINFINENLQKYTKKPTESNVQFVSFNIPINIKYNFKENNNKEIFVSAGVSSIGYLNEEYQYNYELTATEISYFATTDGISTIENEIKYSEQDNIKMTGFNKFNFAGQINLAGGVAYTLGEKMKLHIEPYLKIPITKLATDNIMFSTAGINLYLKFSYIKK